MAGDLSTVSKIKDWLLVALLGAMATLGYAQINKTDAIQKELSEIRIAIAVYQAKLDATNHDVAKLATDLEELKKQR